MNIIEIMSEFKEVKHITRPVLQTILSNVIKNILVRKYNNDNYDVIVNDNSGDIEIYRNKSIVHDFEVEDSNTQICISDARKIQNDLEIGEEYSEIVSLKEFGYRNMLMARQLLVQKLKDQQTNESYKNYQKLVGSLINVTIKKIEKNRILINDIYDNLFYIPKTELSYNDKIFMNKELLVLVENIEFNNNKLDVTFTRASEAFIELLFENEVVEIENGLVTIKDSVRFAGNRTILLVESEDDRYEPVGIVIGRGGIHIKNIQKEVGLERFDIIQYTKNQLLLVKRCLKQYDISDVKYGEDNSIDVYTKQSEVSKIMSNRNILDIISSLVDTNINLFTV